MAAAFSPSFPSRIPLSSSRRQFQTKTNIILHPIFLPLKTNSVTFLPHLSTRPFLRATEQDILQLIADSDGGETSLPALRTYENDLSQLTLVGAVDFEQAITAAASDGGEAASQHSSAGIPAMVVETFYPGSDDRSTVSTRLFLPVKKVIENARILKSVVTKEILSDTTTENILAMTFRQVVLRQLYNFDLVLFAPGTLRNMKDLANPQEVVDLFTLSSSDEHIISLLAEVVCLSTLENISSFGRSSNSLFNLFYKPNSIESKDSSVVLFKVLDDEVLGNYKSLLESYDLEKTNYRPVVRNSSNKWWEFSVYSKLEKIGGTEFANWVSEYVPIYRLQIDGDKVRDVKFKGWNNLVDNKWEAFLTHSQMVNLASILDMYFEDMFTLPEKKFTCGEIKFSNLLVKKKSFSWLKMVTGIFVSGFALITITVLTQLYLPNLSNAKKYAGEHRSLQSSSVVSICNGYLDSTKMEEFCVSIVRRIKDEFCWPGEIISDGSNGARTGVLPKYLEGNIDISSPSFPINEEIKAFAPDIASYQVVISVDSNKIVGFQPTSRVAVNDWASNPLAKELYAKRKLSPGFIEPGVRISSTNEVVVLELLMSVKPDCCFALARPVKSI